MNVQRLLQLIVGLLGDEDSLRIQSKVVSIKAAVANLVGSPNEPTYQTAVVEAFDALSDVLMQAEETYHPAFLKRMDEIGVTPFFTSTMANRLRFSLQQNSATPAIVLEEADLLVSQRQGIILRLREMLESMQSFGFEEEELDPGEAEIGFQIPRDIFDNELGGLTKELGELRRIIRVFSEIAGHPGEAIEVRQISTSDPIFWFGLGILTIRQIGKCTTWALDRWKTFEEIRELRAKTANLKGIPGTDALVARYDDMIEEAVKKNVIEKVDEILGPPESREGRANELATALERALHGLIARVERGMTIEIRFIEPPEAEGELDAAQADTARAFDEMAGIRQQLVFPKASQSPILSISRGMEPDLNPPA